MTEEAGGHGDDQEGKEPVRRGVIVLVLIAGAALAACAYIYTRLNRMEAALQDQAAAPDPAALVAPLQDRVDTLERQLDAVAASAKQLEAGQAELRDGVSVLFSHQRDSNLDRALGEVESLIVMAMHRLDLDRDPGTAISAMEAAQARLRGINDPGLDDVRAQIADDLDALQSVPQVDGTGLALYLTDLAGRVRSLSLDEGVIEDAPAPAAGAEAAGTGFRALLRAMWSEIKQLVVVRRVNEGGAATLVPGQRYFVYQNLRLQLETARLAVLRRDAQMFQAGVEGILEWLSKYFDANDQEVANVIESVRKMRTLELAPPLPDMSSSLETLRAFMHARAGSEGAGDAAR